VFVGFDLDRCIEATGVLFSETETQIMSRMRLLKLLYLANRKSLQETGDPIVDDDVFAMKNGPVLSQTYDIIKGCAEEKTLTAWRKHFKVVDGVQVQMVSTPGTDNLSDYDTRTLIETAHQYRDTDDEDLSELTHTFAEYRRHWNGSQSGERIPEDDLLKALDYQPNQIQMLLEEAKIYAQEQKVLQCR